MAENSNCPYDPERGEFDVISLGLSLGVGYPQGTVCFRETDLLPNWEWRLLVLNYLGRSDGVPVAHRLVSYRQLEHGQLFFPAFVKFGIEALATRLARNDIDADRIREACLALGAKMTEASGVMAEFPLLPRFPVTVQIWPGDEEMAGSANILFDASATHYLHIEDIVEAGYQVARFLMQEYDLLEGRTRGEL